MNWIAAQTVCYDSRAPTSKCAQVSCTMSAAEYIVGCPAQHECEDEEIGCEGVRKRPTSTAWPSKNVAQKTQGDDVLLRM